MTNPKTSTSSSRTQVIQNNQTQSNQNHILRLRPTNNLESQQNSTESNDQKKSKNKKPRVQWTEDVIDNEHMNKKKSKICCIFHPQRSFDEEGEEEHHHDHDHNSSSDESSDSSENEDNDGENNNNGNGRVNPKPNAYEYQPQYENKSKLPKNT